jgi:hypothetical protein
VEICFTAFASMFPEHPAPSPAAMECLAVEISAVVFPEQVREGTLSSQDKSDARHLATSISNGDVGFITSDTKLLRSQEKLWRKYRINVVHPAKVAESLRSHGCVTTKVKIKRLRGLRPKLARLARDG